MVFLYFLSPVFCFFYVFMFVILGEGELRVAEGPFIFRRSTPIFDICVATMNCLHLKNYVYSEHFILIICKDTIEKYISRAHHTYIEPSLLVRCLQILASFDYYATAVGKDLEETARLDIYESLVIFSHHLIAWGGGVATVVQGLLVRVCNTMLCYKLFINLKRADLKRCQRQQHRLGRRQNQNVRLY